MIQIKHCDYFDKNLLNKLILLLPKEYSQLNSKLIESNDKQRTERYCIKNKINIDINDTKCGGIYNILYDEIMIFSFINNEQHKKVYNHKLSLTKRIYHEIRHSYQRLYFPKLFLNNILHYTRYDENQNTHNSIFIEKDADKFVINFVDANIDKIEQILGGDENRLF